MQASAQIQHGRRTLVATFAQQFAVEVDLRVAANLAEPKLDACRREQFRRRVDGRAINRVRPVRQRAGIGREIDRLPRVIIETGRHLRRILRRKNAYAGGIIVAGEVLRLRDDLAAFCRDVRLPVVFSDLEPFPGESEYPPRTAFIGYDTGDLGELAGNWLVSRLRGKTAPYVLIVASREHDSRQQRCEKALRAALPDVDVTVVDHCEFMRSRAYHAVRAHVRQLPEGGCLDAIFATNDEMALGAADALLATPSTATRETVVVGIDGVLEARTLIDTGGSPLRATVVQDTHRLAVGAVDLLVKMHGGHAVPRRTILAAELYEAGGPVALIPDGLNAPRR